MYKARKLNRVVRIPDEKIGEYKELGYSIYDMDGRVVYEPQSDKQKLAALEKENAELKAKIAALEKAAKPDTEEKTKAGKSKGE